MITRIPQKLIQFLAEFGLTLLATTSIVVSGFLLSPILGFFLLGIGLFFVEWMVDRWPR